MVISTQLGLPQLHALVLHDSTLLNKQFKPQLSRTPKAWPTYDAEVQ